MILSLLAQFKATPSDSPVFAINVKFFSLASNAIIGIGNIKSNQ